MEKMITQCQQTHQKWGNEVLKVSLRTQSENDDLLFMGKSHCTADLLFDQCRFDQKSKAVAHSK